MKTKYTQQIKLLNAIVGFVGGLDKIAKKLNINRQIVHYWRTLGYVPAGYAMKLEKLFDRVKAEELIKKEEDK